MALPQGITKEFLDMTYPDQYYKDVIEPAKMGKGPVPSKMQMASRAQPFKAMRIGLDPYLPKSMQTGYDTFRAAPTKAAATALGWGVKGLGYLASLPAQAALMTLGPTSVGADDIPPGKEEEEQEYYDYYTKYGDIGEYANLKIPGIRRRKMMMDKRATEQGIAQVAMQKRIQEEEKKRIEQEKIKTAQDNWKPTYNPASSHAEAQATGGDYHSGHESTVGGQTTDWGPNSAMIARGGLAQYAPRGSYFNGGLASLWPR